ncbi:hypothetical protein, partial [Neisseria lactamica]|uniref:hypothetical protein n=1 Tax=Neisseria lactamica TaxID=486 RepID=UPI0019596362
SGCFFLRPKIVRSACLSWSLFLCSGKSEKGRVIHEKTALGGFSSFFIYFYIFLGGCGLM